MNKQTNEIRETDVEKQKPLLKQAQLGKNSVGVYWEFEPVSDAGHRLNLIFNLLLNNKLG